MLISEFGSRAGKRTSLGFATGVVLLSGFAGWMLRIGPGSPQPGKGTPRPALQAALSKLPVYFIENQGQIDARAAYYVRGKGLDVYFGRDGVTFSFSKTSKPPAESSFLRPASLKTEPEPQEEDGTPRRWSVKMEFVGAGAGVEPIGQEPTPTVVSYFKGQPSDWKTGIPTYGGLIYRDVWPGIDLVYGRKANGLKYEFVVRPGARPEQIQLAYSGAAAVAVNRAGQLEVSTPLGGFRDDVPYTFQEVDGKRVEVPAAFAMKQGHAYGFRVGEYDRSRPLVIDPVLAYAGYIGGTFLDSAQGIAVDAFGNAYVTGWIYAPAVPGIVGPDTSFNGLRDAFVAKVNPQGTALLYLGYIGGTVDDVGSGIAVDGLGNAYVAGQTDSATDFPVGFVLDRTFAGDADGFLAKVNPSGTALLYSSFIGGPYRDSATGIAVDASQNVYVTGTSQLFRGSNDAFLLKVAADASSSTIRYIGGVEDDQGVGIAVHGPSGNVYLAGVTSSTQTTFGTNSDLQRGSAASWDFTHGGGTFDVFVAKVDPSLTRILYLGYIGGELSDTARGIAVDGEGAAYVTGTTGSSPLFPPGLPGFLRTYQGGNSDAFVAKVNPAGTALVYGNYIGGGNADAGEGIVVDGAGSAYVAANVEIVPGNRDAAVYKFNAAGTAATSYFIGGAGTDIPHGIALDPLGNVYLAGFTDSPNSSFPRADPSITGAAQSWDFLNDGNGDAFVVKVLNPLPPPPPQTLTLTSFTTSPSPPVAGQQFTLTLNGSGFDPATVEAVIGATVLTNANFSPKTATQLVASLVRNSAGQYSVVARNGPGGVSSNALTFTVVAGTGPPPRLFQTTTSLSVSPSASVLGQPVTLTAALTPASDANLGLVTFYDGTTVLGSSQGGLVRATLTTSLLAGGTRSLRAYFVGNAALFGSYSTVVPHTVTSNPGTGFSTTLNSFPTGRGPRSVAAGDFNLDGRADLAVANIDGDSVSVLLGNGSGSFQKAADLTGVLAPVSVVVADVDGDKNPDLLVINAGSNLAGVHLGNGDGSFRAATYYETGLSPSAAAVGDFNLDGYPDLAVTKSGDLVSVLLGIPPSPGSRTFDDVLKDYAAGATPNSVAVGDFNSDGRPDLVVGNLEGNNVSVLLGNGAGAFRIPVNYSARSPSSVAVGDFNGDGRADVAAASSGGDYVVVLLQTSAGVLLPGDTYPAGTLPGSVAVGDFNGDGNADLVVANRSSNDVSVLRGNGSGGFLNAVNYPAGQGPQPVVVGEFNGDGRADLAVANYDTDSVYVLLATGVATTAPTLTSLTTVPSQPVVNQPYSLTLTGTGFDPAAVQVLIGTSVLTNAQLTEKSATRILVAALNTSGAGEFPVSVRNGASGTASNPRTLTVMATPAPGALTLTSLSTSPGTPVANQQFTLTLNGSGFDPATVQVVITGTGACTFGTCIFSNEQLTSKTATQLVLQVTLAASGAFTVTVRNGAGGTASAGLTLTVGSASQPPPPGPGGPQILSFVSFGGDWRTRLMVVNTASTSTTFTLRFRDSSGTANVPVTQTGPTSANLGSVPTISGTLNAGGIATYTVGGNPNVEILYAQLDSGTVQVYAFVQNTFASGRQREAQVGLTGCPVTSVFPFDFLDSADMALGVVNPSATDANLTISVRYENGQADPSAVMPFSAGRSAVNKIEETRVFPFGTTLFGRRGTITIQSSGPGVCVVGLRLGESLAVVPAFAR